MDSIAVRVKARIVELYRQRAFTQAALAECLSVDPSAAHGYVQGNTRISLEVLEAVATVTGVPVAELVAPPGSMVRQLTVDEDELLRGLRKWPQSVTRSLLDFFSFFADEDPVAGDTRKMHQYYRRMDAKKRSQLLSLAQLMEEGVLGPDLLGVVHERVLADRAADADARETRWPRKS